MDFLLYYTFGPLQLIAYSDSDWVGDVSDWKSTSEICVYFGHNPILWFAQKQSSVSRSSTEKLSTAV